MLVYLRGTELTLIEPQGGPGIQRVLVIPEGSVKPGIPAKAILSNELSVMIEMFYVCALQYGSHLATWDYQVLEIFSSVPKELSFKMYLIVIILNLNGHSWLVATELGKSAPECRRGCRNPGRI